MCLDYDLKPEQAAKIKAEARKRGYIRVWKVCKEKHTGWYQGRYWDKGLHKAGSLDFEDGGWYVYLSHKSAKSLNREFRKYCELSIKVCYAKPSWIKRLGGDCFNRRVGIFTHLCFPDWDKGDMTIREFRAMCKEKP